MGCCKVIVGCLLQQFRSALLVLRDAHALIGEPSQIVGGSHDSSLRCTLEPLRGLLRLVVVEQMEGQLVLCLAVAGFGHFG